MFTRFCKEQSPSQVAAELLAVSETSHSAGDCAGSERLHRGGQRVWADPLQSR